ncbi:Ig-like domain-containing protein [Methylobacterium sp. 37f]|uniref:Ig-like domain-containing protein n=1 Tax=Methylobacterium sp. 37f TaxID=2817058 RepID=UPI001FFCB64C|nr:Ig-like domain-containing protein [Methylobacterium sp. 37f]MCK2055322.1 hypothetical protein [Methylobacterium sp. 37f]
MGEDQWAIYNSQYAVSFFKCQSDQQNQLKLFVGGISMAYAGTYTGTIHTYCAEFDYTDPITFTIDKNGLIDLPFSSQGSLRDGSIDNSGNISGISITVRSLSLGTVVIPYSATDDGTTFSGTGSSSNGIISTIQATLVVPLSTPPTVSLTVSDEHLVAGETAVVTFQFSEAVTGFTAGDVSTSGGTFSNLTSIDADTYTGVFTPNIDSNGEARISVTSGSYTDTAGDTGKAGQITIGVSTTTNPGGTVEADGVYRFFNTQTGGHFFTISDGEAAQVQATRPDLRPEGTGFGGFATDQGASTEEVYRFFNTKTGGHFFTTSEGERDEVIATNRDYKLEGIGFYDFTADQGAATEEVYRFFNTKTGGHFFTASEAERDQVIATNQAYKFEGIAFYAPEDGATLVI